ncbi:hypothetical protein PGRAT_27385 [Paenibacillus graminis]|uniref:Uncharacterized protein n=1 Tax=Paenibacillus graminis TaxID=189425 RepID=A0A089MHH6_9BACL|nr:hypothetical protein PGRAT_27385 [Paenibacillus graminis]
MEPQHSDWFQYRCKRIGHRWTLTYLLGTQENPSETNVSNPSISWNQKDAELTKFTAYQVQVLDESGA